MQFFPDHDLFQFAHDLEEIKELVDKGSIDLNSKGPNEDTMLHYAVRGNQPLVLKYLLENKVNIRHPNKEGKTALHLACKIGHTDMVKNLLENGARCNLQTHKKKSCPLHYAAQNAHSEVVRSLLDMGANPLISDNNGEIPIQICARLCNDYFDELWNCDLAELQKLLQESKHMECIRQMLSELPDHIMRAQFMRLNVTPKIAYLFLHSQMKLKQSWGNVRSVFYDFTLIESPKRNEDPVLSSFLREDARLIFSHPLVIKLMDIKWNQFGRAGFRGNLGRDLLLTILIASIAFGYWTSYLDNKGNREWSNAYYATVCVAELLMGLVALDRVRRICVKSSWICCPYRSSKVSFHGQGEGRWQKRLMTFTLLSVPFWRLMWALSNNEKVRLVYMAFTMVLLIHVWFRLSGYVKSLPGNYSAGTFFVLAKVPLQFFTVFGVVLMGFIFSFVCLFGSLPDFDNVYKVMTWLIVMGVGHLEPIATDIRAMGRAGVIMVIFYTFTMHFLLLTFFTALMDNRFSGEHEKQRQAANYDQARRILNIQAQLTDEAFTKIYMSDTTDEVSFDFQSMDEQQSKMLSYLHWFSQQYQKETKNIESRLKKIRANFRRRTRRPSTPRGPTSRPQSRDLLASSSL